MQIDCYEGVQVLLSDLTLKLAIAEGCAGRGDRLLGQTWIYYFLATQKLLLRRLSLGGSFGDLAEQVAQLLLRLELG